VKQNLLLQQDSDALQKQLRIIVKSPIEVARLEPLYGNQLLRIASIIIISGHAVLDIHAWL
jgi:hypothetical protein